MCVCIHPLQKDLAQTKQQVEELNSQLATLRAQFEEKTAEQQDLKAKADLMERRLVAASRLIAGLGSERTRWSNDITELDSKKERLIGDCLLTSSFLSYTGAFTFNYRHAMVYDMWQKDVVDNAIPLTTPFRWVDMGHRHPSTHIHGRTQAAYRHACLA